MRALGDSKSSFSMGGRVLFGRRTAHRRKKVPLASLMATANIIMVDHVPVTRSSQNPACVARNPDITTMDEQ